MKTLLVFAGVVGLSLAPMALGAQEAGEVRINAPTLPAGADLGAQLAAPGVREVEVRGLNLTPQQVNQAFLSPDRSTNVLVQISSQLRPGQEIEFRTTDGQRFRVENEGGQLRVRIRDAVVQDQAGLARFLSASGVGRVEIRGVDAAGNRIRLEVRDGVVKRDEGREDRSGRGQEGTSAIDRGRDLRIRAGERAELERARREDRVEKAERPEQVQRPERPDRVERPGQVERIERPERLERSGRH